MKKLEGGLCILELNAFILLFLYNYKEKDLRHKIKQLLKLHKIDIQFLLDILKNKICQMTQNSEQNIVN